MQRADRSGGVVGTTRTGDGVLEVGAAAVLTAVTRLCVTAEATVAVACAACVAQKADGFVHEGCSRASLTGLHTASAPYGPSQ